VDNAMMMHFKGILENLLEQNLSDTQGPLVSVEDRSDAQDPMDLGDLAYAHAAREFTIRIQYLNRKLLRDIYHALQMNKDGDFGICDECSGDIGLERLKAQPTATVCVACKRDQEQRLRRKVA
jgi:DnaK suppressor protein